jgi:hypothetical protein
MSHVGLQTFLNCPFQVYLLIVSFFAAIGGLILLNMDKTPAKNAKEAADRLLIMMSFTYWLVYCLAFGVQKIMPPQWETIILSVNLTRVLAYLLTASCILSLPLNRFSTHQVE